MSLVKYNTPVSQFPRLFDSFWMKDFDQMMQTKSTYPATNLYETDDAYGIELVAPGLSKDAFSIVLEDNKLKVGYKKAEEHEDGLNKRFSVKEFTMPEFSKSFNLPKGKVNEEAIEANYEGGILYLNLPKREEAKPKEPLTIAVK